MIFAGISFRVTLNSARPLENFLSLARRCESGFDSICIAGTQNPGILHDGPPEERLFRVAINREHWATLADKNNLAASRIFTSEILSNSFARWESMEKFLGVNSILVVIPPKARMRRFSTNGKSNKLV